MSDTAGVYPHIRHGTLSDIPAVQQIARQFSQELGFVRRASLERAIANRELYVADLCGQLVGFVNWHARRDGWHTVYELGIHRDYHGQSIGRNLLYAVPTPTRLKCTIDNARANRFYAGAGMLLSGVEQGRKRALNVWELRLLSAFCAGGNVRFPELARASGMAYGIRGDYAPFAWPYMLDINWKDYDWNEHMHRVCTYHPVMAMVADYERPSQRKTLYQQIRDLKAAGVLRVMVCPKFNGAASHIPAWCILAVSVPSQYAGFLPADFGEYRGRHIHLLGGTPADQRDLMLKFQGAGAVVVSLDGSSHESAAKKGSNYESGEWRRKAGQKANYEQAIVYSGRNIVRELNAAADWRQLPLWGVA